MKPLDKVTADIMVFEDLFKRLEEIHYQALEKGVENDYVNKRLAECKELLDRLYIKKDVLVELDWHKPKLVLLLELVNNGILKECLEEKIKEFGLKNL